MTDSHKTSRHGVSVRITAGVTAWPGVEARTGARGEWAFLLGRREIGHLHGDELLHLAFPKAIWEELLAAGRIGYHPIFPGQPGYAERRIDDAAAMDASLPLRHRAEGKRRC